MTSKPTVGLLHPGAMGHQVGACIVGTGHTVLWASEGRSAATAKRAEAAGLQDAGSVADLVKASDFVVSVCPPDAAVDVAHQVAALGFGGVYLDANAVAPDTVRQVAEIVAKAGATPVDGAIFGPPPREPDRTRLYLSGDAAAQIVPLFEGSNLEANVAGPAIGSASALKVCYGGYTKCTSALLLAILSVAKAEGVDATLIAEWERSQHYIGRHLLRTANVAPGRAWRFVGEMEEVADTFASHGVPDGFHRTAAELYRRLAGFKDDENADIDAAVATLLERDREAAE